MAPIQEKVQKISLKKIHYAVMTDEVAEEYREVKTLTMPIELTLTPNYSESGMDAGDRQVAYETQLDSITIAGQLADLPTAVLVDWYGHDMSDEGGVIVNVNDEANYVAVGFESGSKIVWIYKSKFTPTEETNSTKVKGETTFKQSGFAGEALPLSDGLIRYSLRTDDEGVSVDTETFFADVTIPTVTPTP